MGGESSAEGRSSAALINQAPALAGFLGKLSGYTAAAILSQVVQMGCGLVVLRWLPPEQMGVWLTLQAAEAYALFVRLGVINALNREYPFLRGQGKDADAILHVRVTASYMAGCAAVVGAGFLGASLLLSERGADWHWALPCFSVHVAGGLWRSFVEVTFRSSGDFMRLASLQLTAAGLQVVSLPFVAFCAFPGFCLRAVLLAVVLTPLWHVFRPVKGSMVWDWPILLKLLREGLPLFLSNYLNGISVQLPRMVLLMAGGVGLLGFYAPVAAVIAIGTLLPSTILSYLLPRQNFEYGRGRGAAELAAAGWRRAFQLTIVLLPVGVGGAIVAQQLVAHWLPEYTAAIPALLYAGVIVVISPLRLATSLFSTLRAWTPMIVHVATGVGLSAVLPLLMWQARPSDPLVAVVQGVLLAQILHAVLAWPCLRRAVRVAQATDSVFPKP